jgi:hypothetical protein
MPRPQVNWWLRYTSWGWDQPTFGTLAQRERQRRSRLASWLILGLLAGVIVLSPLALQDARARATLVVWVVGLLGAVALNRRGWVTLTGVVLVALFSGGLLAANLASPIGLTMGELPNFDAYVVPLVLAATLLPRASIFLVAAGNSLLIVGNYLLQPHNVNITQDAHLYSSATVQTVSFLVRPIAIQLVLGVVAYLWLRGAEEAIRRADRAEELAILEQREVTWARWEAERTVAIEEGVRYLHQTLQEWTRGDVQHTLPRMPGVVLEQLGGELHAFVERYSTALRAEFQLQRMQEEIDRLSAAVDGWMQGHSVDWPAPAGTPLDRMVEVLRIIAGRPAHETHPPAASPGDPRPSGGPAPWRRPMTGMPRPERPGYRSSSRPRPHPTGGPTPRSPWEEPEERQ